MSKSKMILPSVVFLVLIAFLVGAFFIFRNKKPDTAPLQEQEQSKESKDSENFEGKTPTTIKDVIDTTQSASDTKGYSQVATNNPTVDNGTKYANSEPIVINNASDLLLWDNTLFYTTYVCILNDCTIDGAHQMVSSYDLRTNQLKTLFDQSLSSKPLFHGSLQKTDNSLFFLVSAYASAGAVYYADSPSTNRLEQTADDVGIQNPKIVKVDDTYYLTGGFGDGCGSSRDIYLFNEKNRRIEKKIISTDILCGNGNYIVDMLSDGVLVEESKSEDSNPYTATIEEFYKINNSNTDNKEILLSKQEMPEGITYYYYEKESGLMYYIGYRSAHIFDIADKKMQGNIYYPKKVADSLAESDGPYQSGRIDFDDKSKDLSVAGDEEVYLYNLSENTKEPKIVSYPEETKNDLQKINEITWWGDNINHVLQVTRERDEVLTIGGEKLYVFDINSGNEKKTIQLPAKDNDKEYYSLSIGGLRNGTNTYVTREIPVCKDDDLNNCYRNIMEYLDINLDTGSIDVLSELPYREYAPQYIDEQAINNEKIKNEVKEKFGREIIFTE